MGEVVSGENETIEARAPYYARAAPLLTAGQPATCAGCAMLTMGCDLAAKSGGRAVFCDLYPLRRAAYFQETLQARRRAMLRAGMAPPRE